MRLQKKKKIPKTVDFDVGVNAVFWGLFKSSLMIKLIDSHLEIYSGILLCRIEGPGWADNHRRPGRYWRRSIWGCQGEGCRSEEGREGGRSGRLWGGGWIIERLGSGVWIQVMLVFSGWIIEGWRGMFVIHLVGGLLRGGGWLYSSSVDTLSGISLRGWVGFLGCN